MPSPRLQRTAAAAVVCSWLAGCSASPSTADAPAPPLSTATDGSVAVSASLRERALALASRALDDDRAIALLRELLRAAPKRLSGSPGAEAAVRWGVATMTAIGLQNVRAEPCTVPCWVRGEERAEIVSPRSLTLRVTALGGSIATPATGIEADVIEVRSFEQLRELGDGAHGKIVFFNRPMPRALRRTGQAYGEAVPQRTNGATEAGKAGGVAALVRSMTTAIDGFPHTGAMQYEDGVPMVPAAAVATEDAEALSALLKTGPVRVRLVLGCATRGDVQSANVVGELPGRERPEEVVVVGAHLDAWDLGDGAHDDGAGCAHVLEAMRLLQACGVRPRRTIRAVLFMNEENGLRGAEAYASLHASELRRHVGAIETDSGGFTPQGFTCSVRDDAAAALRPLFLPLEELGAGGRTVPGEHRERVTTAERDAEHVQQVEQARVHLDRLVRMVIAQHVVDGGKRVRQIPAAFPVCRAQRFTGVYIGEREAPRGSHRSGKSGSAAEDGKDRASEAQDAPSIDREVAMPNLRSGFLRSEFPSFDTELHRLFLRTHKGASPRIGAASERATSRGKLNDRGARKGGWRAPAVQRTKRRDEFEARDRRGFRPVGRRRDGRDDGRDRRRRVTDGDACRTRTPSLEVGVLMPVLE